MLSGGRLAAASVHVFTALGAFVAFMAARAVIAGEWEEMFLWLGASFVIDGVDGHLARFIGVKEKIPNFSGERLDWIIDYLTFVFIPAMALVEGGFLPGIPGLALAGIAILSSLYHFCDVGNKSDDGCFVGFPAIWNIVAFYCFAMQLSPALTAVIVVVFSLLTFFPLKWVHPVRTPTLRPLTGLITVIWSVAAVYTVADGFPAAFWIQIVLVACALYGLVLSFSHGWHR